jgi:hypothetical protein
MATTPCTLPFEFHLVHHAPHARYAGCDLLGSIERVCIPDVAAEPGHTAIDAYINMAVIAKSEAAKTSEPE